MCKGSGDGSPLRSNPVVSCRHIQAIDSQLPPSFPTPQPTPPHLLSRHKAEPDEQADTPSGKQGSERGAGGAGAGAHKTEGQLRARMRKRTRWLLGRRAHDVTCWLENGSLFYAHSSSGGGDDAVLRDGALRKEVGHVGVWLVRFGGMSANE